MEAVGFDWEGEPVMLSIYRTEDLRGALRAGSGQQPDRGDRAALLARLEAGR